MEYLFFDTETTGLPRDWRAPINNLSNWPRLVQIAWLIYDIDGAKISSHDYIIKPEGFTIPSDISKIHGITSEQASRDGHDLKSVLLKFQKDVNQVNCLVAHNMSFDASVVGAEFIRCNLSNTFSLKKKICTKEESTNFCAIEGPYGYKWPKLPELYYKLFKTNFEEAHNAAADIKATVKCFWELKKLGVI
jgi:DNA polymerase III subunit epsilon